LELEAAAAIATINNSHWASHYEEPSLAAALPAGAALASIDTGERAGAGALTEELIVRRFLGFLTHSENYNCL
jgi:hypothetical protein